MVADTGFANIIKVDLNLLKKKTFLLIKKRKETFVFYSIYGCRLILQIS